MLESLAIKKINNWLRISFLFRSLKHYLFQQKNLPKISIVVPVHNEEKFIRTCLESVVAQSYKNFECIIVNEACTDKSIDIANEFIQKDSRFSIVHHEKALGLAAARNTGLKHSSGAYVCFLDSDDMFFKNSLLDRYIKLSESKNSFLAGSYGGIVLTSETGCNWKTFIQRIKPFPNNKKSFITSAGECPFNAHAPLLKRELVLKFGGFNAELKWGAEDWDLWYRMMRAGYYFVSSQSYVGGYRQKQNSMIKRWSQHHLECSRDLINKAFSDLPTEDSGQNLYSYSLQYYLKMIKISDRILSNLVFSRLKNDKENYEYLLNQFAPNSWLVLEQNIEFYVKIDKNIWRFYGGLVPDSIEGSNKNAFIRSIIQDIKNKTT